MYHTLKPLVLASQSPRRKEFLENLGLTFSVHAENIDESPFAGEAAEEFVERMAREKAAVVSERYPENFIISADTSVCLGPKILGKPATEEEAVAMLLALSGHTHIVRSAFCVRQLKSDLQIVRSVNTRVRFRAFNEATARAYVCCGESMDKAGGYGIQGRGVVLVEEIVGSYSNVVGLPLAELIEILEKFEIVTPR